eukprot:COSAG03_NODE_6458_length_1057_cov_1.272443_2_plen_118_part_00
MWKGARERGSEGESCRYLRRLAVEEVEDVLHAVLVKLVGDGELLRHLRVVLPLQTQRATSAVFAPAQHCKRGRERESEGRRDRDRKRQRERDRETERQRERQRERERKRRRERQWFR